MRGQKHSRIVLSSYSLREYDFNILLLLSSYCASQGSLYILVRRVTKLLQNRRTGFEVSSVEKVFL